MKSPQPRPKRILFLLIFASCLYAASLAACASQTPTASKATNTPPTFSSTQAPTITTTPTATLTPTTTPTPQPDYQAAAWMYYAGYAEQNTIQANNDLLREANYLWYQLQPTCKISGTNQNPAAVAQDQQLGVRVMPSIMNGFDPKRLHTCLGEAGARSQHVQELVKLVMDNNYDGIDIDYESMNPADREAFSLFIEQLAESLHAQAKLLSVTVHAKTDDQGTWSGPRAQDWPRLGKATDEFKIMVYDYHSAAGEAGPIAPIEWTDQVIAYAQSTVPLAKVYLGIPFYGYDWVGKQAASQTWMGIQALIQRYNATVQRDQDNEAWFTYESGQQHTVRFADALTTQTKIEQIFRKYPQLAGVAIWYVNGEDTDNWKVLREVFHKPAP